MILLLRGIWLTMNRNRRSWSEGQGINAGCTGTSLLYRSIEPIINASLVQRLDVDR